jgi:hypothetical protein
MTAMDAAEERLANALVAMVGGIRLTIFPSQVLFYLATYYQVAEHEAMVHHLAQDDFLMSSRTTRWQTGSSWQICRQGPRSSFFSIDGTGSRVRSSPLSSTMSCSPSTMSPHMLGLWKWLRPLLGPLAPTLSWHRAQRRVRTFLASWWSPGHSTQT